METTHTFPHHRLDAYRVALELAAETKRVMAQVPRGYRHVADQALRASQSTVLLIAEAANRLSAGDKRQRFTLARGECGECAAALELAAVLGLVAQDDARQALELAGRVGAMLTRLAQRFS